MREPPAWYTRPLLALAILAVEYLTITFGFDAHLMLERTGAYQGLGWMGLLGPAVIAFGTALWILGGATLRDALTRSASATFEAPPLWPRLAVHAACFGAFFVLTAVVFGRRRDGSRRPP